MGVEGRGVGMRRGMEGGGCLFNILDQLYLVSIVLEVMPCLLNLCVVIFKRDYQM